MANFTRKPQGPTPETILRDVVAGNVAPIYYLMGEESYFIDLVEDQIVNNLLPPEERDFNLITLFGAETDIDTVITTAKGFPMGAQRLVVVVKEAQNLDNIDRLEFYLKQPQPSTVLIFCHKNGKIDRRLKVAALIGKVGVLYEAEKMRDNQLPSFIMEYVRGKGVGIEQQAAVMLAEYVGADLNRLVGELEKLTITLSDTQKTITKEHVATHIGISKDFNIFELLDALGQKNVVKVNLIANYFDSNPKANPIQRTLPMLFRYFSNLMLAFYAPDRSEQGIANWLGISTWQVRTNILPAMRNYKATKVMNIIAAIRRTDARSKGIDNPFTPEGELLRELLYFILH